MKTYRLVAANLGVPQRSEADGLVCIDVVLRSKNAAALQKVGDKVRAWLDYDSELPGSWVDQGTEREEITLAG